MVPIQKRTLSLSTLRSLRTSHYLPEVSRLLITREELPAASFREVKEVCARLGGRWNPASQTFLFSYDPTPALEIVQASGLMPPKNPHAHFATPDGISEAMIRCALSLVGCNLCEGYRHGQPLHYCHYLPPHLRILEPSAGKGAITRWVRQLYRSLGREDYTLHCCEIDPMNQAILRQQGFEVVAANFFDHRLKPGEAPYDVIIANPPFLGLEYIDHVEWAWSLLNPDQGRLVFIAPNNLLSWDNARSQALRKLICIYKEGAPSVYPRGRFKESGTPVETIMVSLVKQDQSWRMQPYEGFPNWFCYMLDWHIAQTRTLYDQQWQIWREIESGRLPGSMTDPAWYRTRQVLYEFFARAVEHARTEWIEIELDRASLQYMEAHFLEDGLLKCQCERHCQARHQDLAVFHWQKPGGMAIERSRHAPSKKASGSGQRTARKPVQVPMRHSTPRLPSEYVQLALFPL